MDRRWLCAGLSALCFLASARMGWFRGFMLPMLGVGFLFAILWFWFVERMGNVSKQAELYLPTPQELAALKQAALEKQQPQAAPLAQQNRNSANPLPVSPLSASPPYTSPIPASPIPVPSKPEILQPERPKVPVPTGRAVFNLGQEAPRIQPKPPQS